MTVFDPTTASETFAPIFLEIGKEVGRILLFDTRPGNDIKCTYTKLTAYVLNGDSP